jgi:hypothetical protein
MCIARSVFAYIKFIPLPTSITTLSTSYPPIWPLSTRGAFPGRGTVMGWSYLLNSMGCSNQNKYFVVTGGDVTAKLTWRDMLFFLFIQLWDGLYHHCDVSFGWDIPSLVVVSLTWLILALRCSVISLLVRWKYVVCVAFIALPSCFVLLIPCCLLEFQKHFAIFHCVSGHSFPVNKCIVYMAWSIKHIVWWWIVLPRSPWLEPFVIPGVFSAVVAVSWVPTVISLIINVFVSRGYLAMGAIIDIVAGSSPLTVVSVSPIVFWWSCPFVITCVFTICKPIFYVH